MIKHRYFSVSFFLGRTVYINSEKMQTIHGTYHGNEGDRIRAIQYKTYSTDNM